MIRLCCAFTLHATFSSKGFALTWYRGLTWYSSPARPFAASDVPLLVTGQQGSLSPACRQLSRARIACAGGSSEGSTKLKHGTKLGRTLATRGQEDAFRFGRTRAPPQDGTDHGRGCISLRGAVESTEGVSQILPGREFSRWASSPFGVTVGFT